MRLKIISALTLGLLLVSCSSNKDNNSGSDKAVTSTNDGITVENTLNRDVKDARVILKRSKIVSKLQDKTDFVLHLKGSEAPIPYQLDDLDLDGNWDELAFVIDLSANSTEEVLFNLEQSSPKFVQRAHARLGYSETRNDTFVTVTDHVRPADHIAQSKPFLYQFEGPGWESDKVAFRAYFDSRNGKDIFGKTVSKMVIDSIGLPMNTPEGNYHKLKPWGMDVLKVGKSLGSGAIAVLVGDSLHNINEKKAHFKRISDGPVRAIIQITYEGWNINGVDYTVKEHISIWAGQYAYQNKLSIEPKSDDISFVTGLVNFKVEEDPSNWKKEGYHAVVSHGKQSENKDYMGLALIASNSSFSSFLSLDELKTQVEKTSLVKLSKNPDYWFMAGWELTNSGFHDKDKFYQEVERLGEEISTPVVVSY